MCFASLCAVIDREPGRRHNRCTVGQAEKLETGCRAVHVPSG